VAAGRISHPGHAFCRANALHHPALLLHCSHGLLLLCRYDGTSTFTHGPLSTHGTAQKSKKSELLILNLRAKTFFIRSEGSKNNFLPFSVVILHDRKNNHFLSVADPGPGSGDFFTTGSEIRIRDRKQSGSGMNN
jgi:hypothetical protein